MLPAKILGRSWPNKAAARAREMMATRSPVHEAGRRLGRRISWSPAVMTEIMHLAALRYSPMSLLAVNGCSRRLRCSVAAAARVSEGSAPIATRRPLAALHCSPMEASQLAAPLSASHDDQLLACCCFGRAARWKKCCPLHEKLLAAFGVKREADS
ncbi:hypothetical protein Dimus_030412 [Dionaea muscipula]